MLKVLGMEGSRQVRYIHPETIEKGNPLSAIVRAPIRTTHFRISFTVSASVSGRRKPESIRKIDHMTVLSVSVANRCIAQLRCRGRRSRNKCFICTGPPPILSSPRSSGSGLLRRLGDRLDAVLFGLTVLEQNIS